MSDVFVIGTAEGAKKNQWLQMTNDPAVVAAAQANPGRVVKQVPPENLKPRRRKPRGN